MPEMGELQAAASAIVDMTPEEGSGCNLPDMLDRAMAAHRDADLHNLVCIDVKHDWAYAEIDGWQGRHDRLVALTRYPDAALAECAAQDILDVMSYPEFVSYDPIRLRDAVSILLRKARRTAWAEPMPHTALMIAATAIDMLNKEQGLPEGDAASKRKRAELAGILMPLLPYATDPARVSHGYGVEEATRVVNAFFRDSPTAIGSLMVTAQARGAEGDPALAYFARTVRIRRLQIAPPSPCLTPTPMHC